MCGDSESLREWRKQAWAGVKIEFDFGKWLMENTIVVVPGTVPNEELQVQPMIVLEPLIFAVRPRYNEI